MEEALLVIMVKARYNTEEVNFNQLVPGALREYADAVDRGIASAYSKEVSDKPIMGRRDVEKFTSSNGCEVKCVAGFQNMQ